MEGMDCVNVSQDREKWQAVVYTVGWLVGWLVGESQSDSKGIV